MTQLGGSSIFLGGEAGWGQRESLEDFSRTLSGYVDVIVFRGNDHRVLEQFAQVASCPVINGLTPISHPCQALGDLFTIQECFDDLANVQLTFIGDGNNVARSLAIACALTGTRLRLAGPGDYEVDDEFLASIQQRFPAAQISKTLDPQRAVSGADVIYTDVWASMGTEQTRESRKPAFAPFQVNAQLLSAAKPHARFMHCLPARRGEEVTDEVIDGPQSVVFQQAENRMHVQKAVLAWLLGSN
jgi:ornithine carbamoyltransferase